MKAFRWVSIAAALLLCGFVTRVGYSQGTSLVGSAVAENPVMPVSPAAVAAASSGSAGVSSAQTGKGCGGCCSSGCCSNGSCSNGCNGCCSGICNGCESGAAWRVYGEALVLRPRNEGVEYAVPTNGQTNPVPPNAGATVPVQMGPTAIVDPQFQGGFRFGFERILSQCNSISVEYTYYRNDVSDGPQTANTAIVMQPMVFNPTTLNAGTQYTTASATRSSISTS